MLKLDTILNMEEGEEVCYNMPARLLLLPTPMATKGRMISNSWNEMSSI